MSMFWRVITLPSLIQFTSGKLFLVWLTRERPAIVSGLESLLHDDSCNYCTSRPHDIYHLPPPSIFTTSIWLGGNAGTGHTSHQR